MSCFEGFYWVTLGIPEYGCLAEHRCSWLCWFCLSCPRAPWWHRLARSPPRFFCSFQYVTKLLPRKRVSGSRCRAGNSPYVALSRGHALCCQRRYLSSFHEQEIKIKLCVARKLKHYNRGVAVTLFLHLCEDPQKIRLVCGALTMCMQHNMVFYSFLIDASRLFSALLKIFCFETWKCEGIQRVFAAAAHEQLTEMWNRRNRKQNLICISRGKSLQKVLSGDHGDQRVFLQMKELASVCLKPRLENHKAKRQNLWKGKVWFAASALPWRMEVGVTWSTRTGFSSPCAAHHPPDPSPVAFEGLCAENKWRGTFGFFRVSPKAAVSWLMSPPHPSLPPKLGHLNLTCYQQMRLDSFHHGKESHPEPVLCSGSILARSSSRDLPYISFLPFPCSVWVCVTEMCCWAPQTTSVLCGWRYQVFPLPGSSVQKALEMQRLATAFKGYNRLGTGSCLLQGDAVKGGQRCEVHLGGGCPTARGPALCSRHAPGKPQLGRRVPGCWVGAGGCSSIVLQQNESLFCCFLEKPWCFFSGWIRAAKLLTEQKKTATCVCAGAQQVRRELVVGAARGRRSCRTDLDGVGVGSWGWTGWHGSCAAAWPGTPCSLKTVLTVSLTEHEKWGGKERN